MRTEKSHAQKTEELRKIIREKSYREGDFTLASGKKSTFYLDLKETTLNQAGMLLVGALACDLMDSRKLSPYAVGGMTMGADPIAASVAYEAGTRGRKLESFIVRKEPKGHGTGQWLEGVKTFPAGVEFLVVEDVVTTGGSSLKAIKAIREAGFLVKQVLTIVDREEGGAAAFAAANVELISLFRLSDIRKA